MWGGVQPPDCQVVKVPFTVQLQNHSQQLFLGAYCHLVALSRTQQGGAALSQSSESAALSTFTWGTEGESGWG